MNRLSTVNFGEAATINDDKAWDSNPWSNGLPSYAMWAIDGMGFDQGHSPIRTHGTPSLPSIVPPPPCAGVITL